MLLSDWRLLLRRWYSVLAGLTVTAGLAVLATQFVPITYVASAHMVLLPPRASDGTGANPYMGLGGLENMADVVSIAMVDDTTMKKMIKAGVSDRFTVALDRTMSGPILLVTAEELTAAQASRSLELLMKQIPQTTLRLQTDSAIPTGSLIEVSVIGRKGEPAPARKSQIRALLVAVVAGLSLTLLGTAFLDSWILRRSGLRTGAAARSRPTSSPQIASVSVRPDPVEGAGVPAPVLLEPGERPSGDGPTEQLSVAHPLADVNAPTVGISGLLANRTRQQHGEDAD